ncbi:MAG: PAS domain S-box protein [Desulfovibrionales bacterium]|nr:PAS domain S-box protein [Desulfovibrionales bacterium]
MKPYARISLNNKIFISILAVILLISIIIALLARWILISGLTKELELRGVAVAHSIAERGGGFVLDKNYPELLSLIFDEARLRERQHMINYIFVLDRSEQVLSHTFTVPFPAPLSQANPIHEGQSHSVLLVGHGDKTSYDIAVSMTEGLYRIGTVHVGLSKEHIDRLVSKLRFMFLGFISAVIVIVFYVSHRISRYITSPIARLTAISDELSRGNFDVRLDMGEGLDWVATNCPAYKDTNMPCWHFDAQGRKSRRADGKAIETGQVCKTCLFYRKREGDEVIQLADSFMSMVWSIRLYRKRLQESEMKYRSLFDSGPDPIFVVDSITNLILDANPRAEDLYEYESKELLGTSFVQLGHEEIRESLACLDDSRTMTGCVYYPKILHYKKGDRPFYVNMHACPISYGGVNAIIIAVTDITEMMEKDAQLVQAAKMKTLGEMSAGIAHEINQPLNAIKMGSEYLNLLIDQKLEVTDEQIQEMATEISQQVDRATDIINNLREFGKKSGMVMEKVDINGPIRGVLSIIGRQFSIQRINIRLELEESLPLVTGHNNRLQQVFFNLLNNARDAIQEKMDATPGMWGDILVRTCVQDGRVVAMFSDNGPGIPDAVRNKIFEPFFTTKQTGKGMGLGLAITYGIVRDYGGTITIESNPGQGTTFILQFPCAE